jgi:hypothetical protein
MKHFRFNIASLLVVILVLGVGFAALRCGWLLPAGLAASEGAEVSFAEGRP